MGSENVARKIRSDGFSVVEFLRILLQNPETERWRSDAFLILVLMSADFLRNVVNAEASSVMIVIEVPNSDVRRVLPVV